MTEKPETKPETSDRVRLERVVRPLRLTRSELELVEIEFRTSLDCGAEDPGFHTVHEKARRALGWMPRQGSD